MKADERKKELRLILRESREKLKQRAQSAGLPWGISHLSQIFEFIRANQLISTSLPTSPCLTIASYWPIGSELALIPPCDSGAIQPWTDVNSGLPEQAFRWLLPQIRAQRELVWFNLTHEICELPRDRLGLPIIGSTTVTKKFSDLSFPPWILLTPCLAVDREGIRLGYGGGYYDSFLSQHGAECLSIACVPEEFLMDAGMLPRESHDQPIDVIITDQRVLKINTDRLNIKIARIHQLLNAARG